MTDADKPAFLQAMIRVAVALREKDPDVVMLRVYFETLQDLEIEFVVGASERLVRGTWFPKVSEWRAAAIAIEVERRQAQQALLRRLTTPLCDVCGDTGWTRDPQNRALRCACRELRRLEVLGRRPWPELPPEATKLIG